jgi:hypothetical protein
MSATLGALLRKLDPVAAHRHLRAARSRRGRELGRVEQRRHRPRRLLRAELHAGRRRRHRRLRQGDQDRRPVRHQPGAVAGAGRGRRPARSAVVHPPGAAPVVRRGRRRRGVPARAGAAARDLAAVPDLEYSEDRAQLAEWMPLVMDGRAADRPVAATRMARGTDVNFGALTRSLFTWLDAAPGFALRLEHEVVDLRQGRRRLGRRRARPGHRRRAHRAPRGSCSSAPAATRCRCSSRSGIPEARGYGAFPVSGQWLRCTDRDVIARHHAKVYGQAEVGAPPMSRAAPRHPVDRRHPGAVVRALRRLHDEVPEAGLGLRLSSARSASTTCARWSAPASTTST